MSRLFSTIAYPTNGGCVLDRGDADVSEFLHDSEIDSTYGMDRFMVSSTRTTALYFTNGAEATDAARIGSNNHGDVRFDIYPPNTNEPSGYFLNGRYHSAIYGEGGTMEVSTNSHKGVLSMK